MQTISINLGDNGMLTVVLRGEVDYVQASRIAAAVREAVVNHRPGAVCVDLAEVTFLDSSGISVLIQGRNAAEQIDARFAVERPTGGIGYLLKDRVANVAEFVDGGAPVPGGGTVMDP